MIGETWSKISHFQKRLYVWGKFGNFFQRVPADAIPLSEMHISVKLCNILRRRGVASLYDLAAINPRCLESIKGMGPRTIEEIRYVLAQFELEIGDGNRDTPNAPAP